MKPAQHIDVEIFLAKISRKTFSVHNVKLMLFITFVSLTNACYSTNYVFAVHDVNYRCINSKCDTNSTTISSLSPDYDKCHTYSLIDDQGNCTQNNIHQSVKLDCDKWVYEEPRSYVAEFQLGCQDWKRTLVGSVHNFGYMVGLLFVGPISDKFGRKKLIIFYGVSGAMIGLARSFTASYWIYVTLEMAEAVFGDPYSPAFMLGVEMVTKENRSLVVTILAASTSIGGMLLALIAWLVPYWRYYLRVLYAPSLLFFFFAFYTDESIRWLLSKGRNEQAKDIIRNTAKADNIEINEKDLDRLKCEKTECDRDLLTLLKMTVTSRTILLRCLACVLMWFAVTFNHFVFLINSVSLEGNKYLNYGLTTLSELPASIILGYVLRRFKRKMPLLVSFLLTGTFCAAELIIPEGYFWLSNFLSIMAKLNCEISFQTVYLYTSELFPTYTRNTMHALCSSIGRIGAILAPQTPLLMQYWVGFPSMLVAGISLVTGCVIMLLPDTAEDVLPDTVQQAETVGSNQHTTDTFFSRL